MPRLSTKQIYDVAIEAGFSPHQAVTWTAIARAESGGRTSALNSDHEYSVGLWQINLNAHKDKYGDLHNALNNAKAAYDISNHGTDMRPWTTTHPHNKGTGADYRTYLPEIQKEIGLAGDPRGTDGYGTPHTASSSTPRLRALLRDPSGFGRHDSPIRRNGHTEQHRRQVLGPGL